MSPPPSTLLDGAAILDAVKHARASSTIGGAATASARARRAAPTRPASAMPPSRSLSSTPRERTFRHYWEYDDPRTSVANTPLQLRLSATAVEAMNWDGVASGRRRRGARRRRRRARDDGAPRGARPRGQPAPLGREPPSALVRDPARGDAVPPPAECVGHGLPRPPRAPRGGGACQGRAVAAACAAGGTAPRQAVVWSIAPGGPLDRAARAHCSGSVASRVTGSTA